MSAIQLALVAMGAFPIVAGLHRYSVNYGYRGMPRREAWEDAVLTWKGATVIGLAVCMLHAWRTAP